MRLDACFENLLAGKPPVDGWLSAVRKEALGLAGKLKLPDQKHEDWRLTELSSLYGHEFSPVAVGGEAPLFATASCRFEAHRIVFVDGRYNEALSELQPEPGVKVSPLGLEDAALHLYFAKSMGNDVFAALNTKSFEDCAWVQVTGEAKLPVHILYISTKCDTPSAIYPRCLVLMEKESRATLIEEHVGEGTYFSNAVAEIWLHDQAQLKHVRVQREDQAAFHVGQTSVECAKGSAYVSTSVALGARLSRHTLHVKQKGEGAEITLDGLALLNSRQVADTHTLIHHGAPYGKSSQLHKCIADGASHGIFSGRVVVAQGAKGTDSVQSSRNLLLSEKAKIDAQPELEIFNDDVSCKHGATVGQIDPEEIFYLKSRGLSEKDSRNLLTYAFVAEIVGKIAEPTLIESLKKVMLEKTQ